MNEALAAGHCVGHADPDIWFRQDTWRSAKVLCGPCPVRDTCLKVALAHELSDYQRRLAQEDGRGTTLICEGVWGGKSAPERKRMLAERMRVAA